MKILYCAIDQTVPGTIGGSVHVTAVAEGLAALGHEVHVLTGRGHGRWPQVGVSWHALRPPLGMRQLRLLRSGSIRRMARRLRPDVVIERYYNFGGEGLLAARDVRALAVLEVNAPIVDFPQSLKRRLDRALLVEPMRRWRDWQCRMAHLIITPSRAIVPAWVRQDRVVELEWGADTVRFHPGATGPVPYSRKPERIVAIFAGAFRAWHGAIHLVNAIRRLRDRGRHDIDAVLVGDGPERAIAQAAASGLAGVHFTGAIAHTHMPAALAAADVGVAPFDVSAHPPLALDFYWSPLKIFEYMASGLPVVAPAVDRIPALVSHEREGILYDPESAGALAGALERLTDRTLRQRLSAAARERAVRDYSWAAHCKALEEAIRKEEGKRRKDEGRLRPERGA
jgi:glycosyltransferase involved in cell wall biosynthesis